MLILSRKIGETLIIGDGENEIRVMVLRVVGSRVSLGIDAPKSVSVDREEIRTRKTGE